jgi:hypothetical protein
LKNGKRKEDEIRGRWEKENVGGKTWAVGANRREGMDFD